MRPHFGSDRRVLVGIVALVVLAGLLLWIFWPGAGAWSFNQRSWSEDPTPVAPAASDDFGLWVEATGSAPVAQAWADARADGVFTEAERVEIEGIAASEPVPFGLGSPVEP